MFCAASTSGTSSNAASRQHALISAPVQSRSLRPALAGVEAEPLAVHPPDRLLLPRPGQVEEERRVEPLGPANSGGSLRDVVGRADDERRRCRGRSARSAACRTAGPRRPSRPGRWRRRRPAPSRPRRSRRRTGPSRRRAAAPGGRWPRSGPRASPAARRRRGPASAGPSRCPAPWQKARLARARRPEQEHAPGADAGRGGRAAGARRRTPSSASRPPRSANVSPPRCRRQQARLLEHARSSAPRAASAASRPWRTSERLKAPSASNRVRPAAASSTAARPSPSGSSPGSVAIAAGDRLELVAAGQVVLDDDELLLQLDGDLDDRRQDDDEGAGLLAGGDLGVEGLDDLGASPGTGGSCAAPAAPCRRAWPGRSATGSRPAGRRRRRRRRLGGWPARARPRSMSQVARDQPLVAAEPAISASASSCSKRLDPEAGEAARTYSDEALGERHGGLLGGDGDRGVGRRTAGPRRAGSGGLLAGPGRPAGPGGTRR